METGPTVCRYRGVSWHKRDRKWRAKLKTGGRHIFLGNYPRAEDAARVWDVAARIVQGPDAKLNFDGQPPLGMALSAITSLLKEKGVIC